MEDNRIINTNSVILGLFLSISMVTKLITSVISFSNNILIFTFLLFAVSVLMNLNRMFSIKFLCVNAVIFSAFLISTFFITDSTFSLKYFSDFIIYGTIGMFLVSLKFNSDKTIKTIATVFLVFSLLTLLKYIPRAEVLNYDESSMEISYTMVIGLSAAFFSWKLFNKFFRVLLIISSAICIYYLFFLSDCRGAVLSLIVLIGVYILRRSKRKALWAVIFVLLTVFIIFGFNMIIEALLKKYSDIHWLNRFKFGDDMFTGRSELFNLAKDTIMENFFFGKGIGYFETIANGQYTHNIFLQLFCEFGAVIGSILSAVFIVLVIKGLFKSKNDFELFCIIQFIPRLLVSSVYWQNPFIWIFIYSKLASKSENFKKLRSVEKS